MRIFAPHPLHDMMSIVYNSVTRPRNRWFELSFSQMISPGCRNNRYQCMNVKKFYIWHYISILFLQKHMHVILLQYSRLISFYLSNAHFLGISYYFSMTQTVTKTRKSYEITWSFESISLARCILGCFRTYLIGMTQNACPNISRISTSSASTINNVLCAPCYASVIVIIW